MAQPYLGEIRLTAFNFAPVGWFLCQGQIVSIAQYSALYSLIGTTYGGDGISTFALPDLRGRTPVHFGNGNGLSPAIIGLLTGTEQVTLTTQQMPAHTHTVVSSAGTGNATSPSGNYFAACGDGQYANAPALASAPFSGVGGSLPHENRQPSLTISFIIAWEGVFPSQN